MLHCPTADIYQTAVKKITVQSFKTNRCYTAKTADIYQTQVTVVNKTIRNPFFSLSMKLLEVFFTHWIQDKQALPAGSAKHLQKKVAAGSRP